MDKISGILPSNSRLKSVDFKGAHPVRPGVPSFGQPVGSTSSMRDRVSISEEALNLAAKDTLLYQNPRESTQSKIATEVTKKFFETRLQPDEKPSFSEEMNDVISQQSPTEAPSANEVADSEVDTGVE